MYESLAQSKKRQTVPLPKHSRPVQFNSWKHRTFLLILLVLCSVKINSQNQPYLQWNIYTRNAQDLLLRVSALHGCHYQGVLTVVKVVLSKWPVVWTAVKFHKIFLWMISLVLLLKFQSDCMLSACTYLFRLRARQLCRRSCLYNMAES